MQEVKNRFSGADVEVGLLDVLVILAENVKLLVIGSLLVGLCALGIGFMLPQTYQSVAVLQAEQPTASLMMTAVVLDPVIKALGLAKDETLEVVKLRVVMPICWALPAQPKARSARWKPSLKA